jgi:iron complex outermembrane receptor protein
MPRVGSLVPNPNGVIPTNFYAGATLQHRPDSGPGIESNDVDLGKRPLGIPTQMASAWGDYTFHDGPLAGFGFAAGVRYVGSTYGDAANTILIPDNFLVDAAIHYDLGALSPR